MNKLKQTENARVAGVDERGEFLALLHS